MRIALSSWLALMCLGVSIGLSAQTGVPPTEAPPRVLLLVHLEFKAGKAHDGEALEMAIAREFDRLGTQVYWIETQAVTGPAGALYFDPADSFAQLDEESAALAGAFSKHPELAATQKKFEDLIASSRTLIAIRRDDLGFRSEFLDLSKARYLRMNVYHVRPGHDVEFAALLKTVGAAREKARVNSPWVVYQVDAGLESPAFLVVQAMRGLKDVDDLLAKGPALQAAEAELGGERLQQMVREVLANSESNIYAISPQMSHVSPAFAAGNPGFWRQHPPRSAPAQVRGGKGSPPSKKQ